ncbi:MAG: phosphodiester glycosidase family protein, partial [Clostridia bacterium]|nr:phosphodiester glycosidase family protein [Clostridia bacterium]
MYVKLDFEKYKDFVSFEKKFDYNCEYIITKIIKQISEKERIFPRVRLTKNNQSLYDFMNNDEILFAINAGIFNTGTGEAECVLISNNKIYKDQLETYIHKDIKDGGEKREELYILGINKNGDLKIYNPSITGEEIIADGCMDAVMGFVPLIENYNLINLDNVCSYISMDKHPRQIIGQLENDDYIIMTVLKPGMTLKEAREILKRLNVKNAFNLDGGS